MAAPFKLVADGDAAVAEGAATADGHGRLTFHYEANSEVTQVSPKLVPGDSGSLVHVTGTSFLDTDTLSCRFGETLVVPATFISSSLLACEAPAWTSGLVANADFGRVPLQVTNNGVDYTHHFVEIEYVRDVVVESVQPSKSSEQGGVLVTVTGRNFIDTDLLCCRFGLLPPVAAIWVSSTKLRCSSPLLDDGVPMGPAELRVSNNAVDFSANFLEFTYQHTAAVFELVPDSGPAGGGTVLSVHGTNFVNGTGLHCRFGDLAVPAIFATDQLVFCVTPAADQDQAGPVAVEVANNHQHGGSGGVSGINPDDEALFTRDGVLFIYQTEAAVASVAPQAGPVGGNTTVTVHGSGFLDAPTLRCRFGDDAWEEAFVVPARFVSPDELECVSPAEPTGAGAGAVPVEVTNNGVDYTFNGVPFLTYDPPRVHLVSPRRGLAQGGTLVSVTGSGFSSPGDFLCRFGGGGGGGSAATVPAAVRSESLLECVAPAGDAAFEVQRVTASRLATVGEVQEVSAVAMVAEDEMQVVRTQAWGWSNQVQRVASGVDLSAATKETQVVRLGVGPAEEVQVITTGAAGRVNEKQVVQLRADTALRGSFTLTYGQHTTPALPFHAPAKHVQAALNSLPSVNRFGSVLAVAEPPGVGPCSVAEDSAGRCVAWEIEFVPTRATDTTQWAGRDDAGGTTLWASGVTATTLAVNVDDLSCESSSVALECNSAAATVAISRAGLPCDVQTISIVAPASIVGNSNLTDDVRFSGAFKLAWGEGGSSTTVSLPHDASAGLTTSGKAKRSRYRARQPLKLSWWPL
jgi:hypothetical protein